MKRAEFLERLMQALAFMTAEERRSVREYYEELRNRFLGGAGLQWSCASAAVCGRQCEGAGA